MKKMRKIFAVLLTLAMVLGMSMTSFAAGESDQEVPATPATKGSITVQGLVPNEKTTLSIYKVVEWDAAKSEWKLAAGITATEVSDLKTKPITIDWAKIAEKRDSLTPIETKRDVDTTSVKFENLEIGAYYVYAQSSKTTYNPMGEAVYEYGDDGLMKPAAKTIDAKGSTYTLTKAFKGENGTTTYQVVERGQVVPFTITAVFPSYDKEATDKTFQITDEPTGMKVTEVTVKVGETPLAAGENTYSLVSVNPDGTDGAPITTLPAAERQKVRVRFASSYIGTENAHAGQTVTVEVKAQITDAATFANKASSNKGYNVPEVKGKLGSITINKYDENYGKENVTSKLLAGAEFSIAPIGENNTVGDKLQFVLVKEGEYKLATADDTENKVTNVVATNGTVKVTGLNDGTYKIVEEKAPAGYSVVPVDNVTIENGDNPVATANVSDTKLHSLPHTGGIGTTIFTIAGCVIMIAAAGLFFASRKKSDNK